MTLTLILYFWHPTHAVDCENDMPTINNIGVGAQSTLGAKQFWRNCGPMWKTITKCPNFYQCGSIASYASAGIASPVLCCWLCLLTCKTVSRITYTVLVETMNPDQSNPIQPAQSTDVCLSVRPSHSGIVSQESCAIAKMTAQCALYIGALKIFETPWLPPRLIFPTFFHWLLFGSTLWMFLQNLKSVALPVTWIIGVPKKFGQSLDRPTLHFLQNI